MMLITDTNDGRTASDDSGNSGYSMADLVEATGFTERQIRHYIAEELVAGAVGMGRKARYGEQTMLRLQLIRKLRGQDVQPLGRPLTLKEMKNTLDSVDEDQMQYLLSGSAMFSLIDTEESNEMTPSTNGALDARLNREYTDYHEKKLLHDDPDLIHKESNFRAQHGLQERSTRETNDWLSELGALGSLLQRLRETLERLADEDAVSAQPEGDTWVRVKSPDIEIHLKTPKSASDRARLRNIKSAVEKLIELGPDPYRRY